MAKHNSRSNEKVSSPYNFNMPNDLLPDIFSKLPVKSLCRFKCVSKPWCSWIEDSIAINNKRAAKPFEWEISEPYVGLHVYLVDENRLAKHMNTHRINKFSWQNIKLCDDLICFDYSGVYSDELYKLGLVNFITQAEVINLPPLERNRLGNREIDFGFGFDPSSKKYKVLCWYRLQDYQFLVLTLEKENNVNREWRKLSQRQVSPYVRFSDRSYVSANGALFWFNYYKGRYDLLSIIFFDLSMEEFGEIMFPANQGGPEFRYSMFKFEGSLCLVKYSRISLRDLDKPLSNLMISDIWMLKDIDNSIWVSILSNLSLPLHGVNFSMLKLKGAPNPGEILIEVHDCGRTYSLFVYSFLNSQFKKIEFVS